MIFCIVQVNTNFEHVNEILFTKNKRDGNFFANLILSWLHRNSLNYYKSRKDIGNNCIVYIVFDMTGISPTVCFSC